MPPAVIFIASGMLFLGAAPLPYGYYMLLRLVACAVFVWAAFVAHSRKRQVLPWVLVVAALLFNPFMKVHFRKDVWAPLDIAAGVLLLASYRAVKA